MPNERYIRGKTHEQELKRKLENVGFPLVMRSAGSKGPVDISAFGYNDIYLFQCKSTEKTVITNELVEQTFKTKRVKDLTNLPSRYIKILTFRAKGDTEFLMYRWNNTEWKFIQNKIF